jgi:hypothetical protein
VYGIAEKMPSFLKNQEMLGIWKGVIKQQSFYSLELPRIFGTNGITHALHRFIRKQIGLGATMNLSSNFRVQPIPSKIIIKPF